MPNKFMVANRYELIKQTENFNQLVSLGVIPMQIFDWLTMYEFYLNERKTEPKMQAYQNTADEFNFSDRQIMNLVSWFELKQPFQTIEKQLT